MSLIESNKQILTLLASGKAMKEIANHLDMHNKTIEKRLENLRRLFGCTSTTQLVVKYMLGEIYCEYSNS